MNVNPKASGLSNTECETRVDGTKVVRAIMEMRRGHFTSLRMLREAKMA